ncbi:MAG: DedA family protein [Alphaproteobacteria bacterium]|nr:DedA family protein [Alphaproteobacteria bacterium]
MLRPLYDWTMGLAAHRHALAALAIVSFAEASFFPIPADILLIPMIIATREKAWRIALTCTIASVLGGMFGYGIGFFLFETLGKWVLDFYGYAEQFARYQSLYNKHGFWIVMVGGLTPLPYKVVTIASGLAKQDLFTFVLGSGISRGLRYFAVALLLYHFGPPIRDWIERRMALAATIFVVLLIGGFALIKYVI